MWLFNLKSLSLALYVTPRDTIRAAGIALRAGDSHTKQSCGGVCPAVAMHDTACAWPGLADVPLCKSVHVDTGTHAGP